MVSPSTGPFAGIRVVDFTRFVSGPYASLLMAEMGAEVIKIEVPPSGDSYRTQGAVRVDDESVLFATLNRGKKSVAIDFRAPQAKTHIERLLASADVLLENSRPGSLKRHQLDYASVHPRHPALIYGSVSGFGSVGPSADRGGFDLILQAESGLMSVTGHESSGPAKVGAPVTDVGAGITCIAGIAAALFDRTRTGRGTHVTTSLLEFALASLSTIATAAFVTGDAPGLLGTHSPTFAPYGAFRASDGWIAVAGAGSDDLWLRMCDALELDHLVEDPRFVDNRFRVAHRDELTHEIEQRTLTGTVDQWTGVLAEHGVPSARIADVNEAFSSPQAQALGIVEQIHTEPGTPISVVAAPLRLDAHRGTSDIAAPRLGAHTEEVLYSLGATAEDLRELGRAGVIAT